MRSLIILFALVFATLSTLSINANAKSAASCAGKDLMAALKQDKPRDYQAIIDAGNAEENGNTILWKIEKPGSHPSWLFGTMHLTDDRLIDVPDDVLNALNGAATVAVENIDVMDPSISKRQMKELADILVFADGSDLRDHMTKEQQETLRSASMKYKLSYFKIIKMKPWLAASLLAIPPCEKFRKSAGKPFLDKAIVDRAYRINAKVVSLETIAEQLNAMDSLPMTAQIAFLTSSARLAEKAEDFLETMITLYLDRKIGAIPAMAKYFGGSDATTEKAYASFHQKLVVKRNGVMLERSLPLIEKGEAFIAVGALHLPGKQGLVELLREKGYTVTAVW